MRRQITTEKRNICHGGFEVGDNVIFAASCEMAKVEKIGSSRSSLFTFFLASLPFIGGVEDGNRERGVDDGIRC